MTNTSTIDITKAEALSSKVLKDSSATVVTTLAAFGDRLGQYRKPDIDCHV